MALEIIPVWKPKGKTSTEVLLQVAQTFPHEKCMHTGALDPMAEGLLLVVRGTDRAVDIAEFTHFDKTYECTALLGLTTDTWDILGLLLTMCTREIEPAYDNAIQQLLPSFTGAIVQEVPIFSNLRYRNKRMYQWAREGKAHLVPSVTRVRHISSLSHTSDTLISAKDVLAYVQYNISLVQGDYRQQEIAARWEQWFHCLTDNQKRWHFPLVQFTLTGESGTYVRSFVQGLGAMLGYGATTWHITRTRIGPYTISSISK